MKSKKYFKNLTNLWTIALVLDFTSPKSSQIVNGPFPPIKRFAVYPFQIDTPMKNECDHVVERFMGVQKLRSWISSLQNASSKENKKEENNARPLATALRKIRFDLQFHLHPINQIIVNVPDGDSCGQNACEALHELEGTLISQGRKIDLFAISPLNCKLSPKSPITIRDAKKLSVKQIVARTKDLALKKPAEAETGATPSKMPITHQPTPQPSGKSPQPGYPVATPVPSPSPLSKHATATVVLSGPPVGILFSPVENKKEQPLTVQVPTPAHLAPGKWKLTLSSPSWTKDIPGLEIELKEKEMRNLKIQKIFDDQVTWIESEKKEDGLLVFEQDGKTRRILIPAGSPPIPVPKNIDWKQYPVPVSTPSPSSKH